MSWTIFDQEMVQKVALRLRSVDDLVVYFMLRLRMSPQGAWELDRRVELEPKVPVPWGVTYPSICVACGKLHSQDGSKLFWGCTSCGKIVSRRTYHCYKLDAKVNPEALDHALALALYYIGGHAP